MRYAKRYSESRLGRWTAKNTVARSLGVDPGRAALRSIVVTNAADGAPEIRQDSGEVSLTIAMTDRADWAVCMVASAPVRVGCDLEIVEPRSTAFVRDYFTDAEQATVAASSQPDQVSNLIWSAKESALKVMRTGLRRDTRTVEVTIGGKAAASWQPLEIRERSGVRFAGWWARFGEFVLTCAADREVDPPVSLEQPPAIASGTPGHAWMTHPLRH
jgi:4'-phosphopantetheinyl transferase